MANTKLTPTMRMRIIDMFIAGKTAAEVSKATKVDKSSCTKYFSGMAKAIVNAHAARSAAGNQWNTGSKDIRFHNPELANEEFLKVLSDPNDPDAPLTEEEINFCHIFVTQNNYELAGRHSGIDVGLFTEKEIKSGRTSKVQKELADTYMINLKMRISYLRQKPNVQRFIRQLQETDSFDKHGKIDKELLQHLILTEIETLRDNSSSDMKKLNRDYVQMLGRTFGGFTERVEVGVVDHKESVRKLAEAQQKMDTLEDLRKQKEAEKAQEEAILSEAKKKGALAPTETAREQ